MASDSISVLFVCLGNICRSTMAEGVFESLTANGPYKNSINKVDSAGTAAYHTGSEPDDRTMSTLQKHGVSNYDHAARQVRLSDFEEFDYIFAMDRSNLSDLKRLQQRKADGKAKVMLFGEYSGGRAEVVEDPYYGGQQGFEKAYEQCLKFSGIFLQETFPDIKS